MQRRDIFIFAIPVGIGVLVGAFACFLYWQISAFEERYRAENIGHLAHEARILSTVLAPMIQEERLDDAVKFCRSFSNDSIRITLIDPAGKVMVDNDEDPAFMDNHSNREEVRRAADDGRATSSERFSESVGRRMIYHAVPLQSPGGVYVLRTAMNTARISHLIDLSRANTFWTLLFGGQLVLLLGIYLVYYVRRPLVELQRSLDQVAAGFLDTAIPVPRSGIVREMALGISAMTDQLRRQLAVVTAERNERSMLFDTMSEGVLLLSEDGKLLCANHAAQGIFQGFHDDGDFDLSRCQIPELIQAVQRMNHGEVTAIEEEFTIVAEDGTTRNIYVKARRIEEAPPKLLLTAVEVTNLRRLESFRSDFVADVSHEIKTPLTCIVGAAEALEENPPEELRQRMAEMLKSQCRRLNALLTDILNLSSLEREQHSSKRNFSPLWVDDVIANAVNVCRDSAVNAGMRLEMQCTGDSPVVQGDAALLEQALSNLILNAVRYSGGGNIWVGRSMRPGAVWLEVRDDGCGIPPEHRERIFQRFYRVDKSRSRELGGTGLGLAIVKHIAQLHGGNAELLDNHPGEKGCCFRIVLPG